jgi:glycosyltransferase involved in cell wall biosynthesis
VTVTNGKRPLELSNCIASIKAQTYLCTHYVLVDNNFALSTEIKRIHYDIQVCHWDGKIGGDGWLGQRWYAAAPQLITEDVTFFCNDDDWYEDNHVQTIMEKIKEGYDWAYSFRKVCDSEGNFLFLDNCEALGEVSPVWVDPNHHFVDWCMWGMKTECLKQISPVLNNKDIAVDRYFYAAAKQVFPNFAPTLKHTFNFRLGGGCGVQKEFFELGNAEMLKRHNGVLPWVINDYIIDQSQA